MDKKSDDVYRENIRKKLGLGDKKLAEETPIVDAKNPDEVEEAPAAEVQEVEPKEQTSPEAEAIINEVLQFIDEKEKEAADASSKLMLKSLYLHLAKNKAKILQKMADDAK